MNDALLHRISVLAGAQRALTFRAAAEFVLEHECRSIIETGSYRGIPEDGQSTLIIGYLANEMGQKATSYELSSDSINRADELLARHGMRAWVEFVKGDSVSNLSSVSRDVSFAYLDSFDHDPENPGPCQRHELAEIGAILGKMTPPCAILLDDFVPETGGKTLLGAAFLEDRGWKLIANGYQKLYGLL